MATIVSVKARSIFDSRGNPTVEVDIYLSDGYLSRAAVPSGASTGVYEALELRDGGKNYMGKGVSKAVGNVNKIIGPALIGKDPVDQTGIDNFMVQELDGTQNQWGWCKQKLGANAILAVSLAVCKAGAYVKKENKERFEFLKIAIEKAGYTGKVVIGMDVAASEFYTEKDQKYDLNFKEERVGKAINEKSCNALSLKLNQIGSVTESIEAVKISERAGRGVMTSHRSGETEDTFIVDLAVGLATGQINTGTGAPCMQVRDKSSRYSLGSVDLMVYGGTTQATQALVDTGATHNFMRTQLARDVGLTISPSNVEVKAVNSKAKVEGFAHKVPVQIGDWTGQLDFTVMGMDDFDVILGQDFLKGNNAIVIPFLDKIWLVEETRIWILPTHSITMEVNVQHVSAPSLERPMKESELKTYAEEELGSAAV